MRWFVFTLLLVSSGSAWAQQGNPGDLEAQVVGNLMESNYGLLLGLFIGAWGAWIFLINQKTWGIAMIVLGVAITAFPGMFQGLMVGVQPFVQAAGGTTPNPNIITGP